MNSSHGCSGPAKSLLQSSWDWPGKGSPVLGSIGKSVDVHLPVSVLWAVRLEKIRDWKMRRIMCTSIAISIAIPGRRTHRSHIPPLDSVQEAHDCLFQWCKLYFEVSGYWNLQVFSGKDAVSTESIGGANFLPLSQAFTIFRWKEANRSCLQLYIRDALWLCCPACGDSLGACTTKAGLGSVHNELQPYTQYNNSKVRYEVIERREYGYTLQYQRTRFLWTDTAIKPGPDGVITVA